MTIDKNDIERATNALTGAVEKLNHREIALVLRALFISTHPVEKADTEFRESTVTLWSAVLNVADPGMLVEGHGSQPEVLWNTLLDESRAFLERYASKGVEGWTLVWRDRR